MAPQRKVRFVLRIPAHTMQSYYQGAAREVVARADDGRTIRFPANILRPFVGREGVHGRFELEFDADNKFVAIHRIGDI